MGKANRFRIVLHGVILLSPNAGNILKPMVCIIAPFIAINEVSVPFASLCVCKVVFFCFVCDRVNMTTSAGSKIKIYDKEEIKR